ncbi:hypothetical protein ACF3DV_25320 [Chlorogloeopsis fritschii PCC 9212]|uniref:hypothetical protein n=1 Tax=Chlorogloeopsis fritschii TaxID=1124 RepID=UPI0012F6BA45|nr:hypothetical protein [Chlorogloeopsis fritschii]
MITIIVNVYAYFLDPVQLKLEPALYKHLGNSSAKATSKYQDCDQISYRNRFRL